MAEPDTKPTTTKDNENLLIETDRKVKKMIKAIQALGCEIPKEFFACRPCDAAATGGFVMPTGVQKEDAEYKPKIILCENNMIDRQTFESTVIHELIHAYDLCRAKVDFTNCLHHACMEVRASTMSGECDYTPELFRGNTQFLNGKAECSKRRAILSLSANPHCKDAAKDAVATVFSKCYDDIAPLDFYET